MLEQEDFDDLERENLRLRAALEEKSTLIEVAQNKIKQSRVQLRHAEDAAAKAMSRATSALALSQSEAGPGGCSIDFEAFVAGLDESDLAALANALAQRRAAEPCPGLNFALGVGRWRSRAKRRAPPTEARAASEHSAAPTSALERLDKVTWCREDAEVPAGCTGVVQGVTPDGCVRVEWLSGAVRTHGRGELARRVDIGFEGAIVMGDYGDHQTYCTVSFPGKEAMLWEKLVQQADGGELSTACVFLIKTDARNGAHSVDPDHLEGKCFCHALYGEQKDWGCRWFTEWDANVQEAHKRGQICVVFYFRGHLAKHGADRSWSSSGVQITPMQDQRTMPHVEGELRWEALAGAARAGNLWDDGSGLGGSQRGEVAWLNKCGIPFVRLDVGDGAPGASEIAARLVAQCTAACARLERELPEFDPGHGAVARAERAADEVCASAEGLQGLCQFGGAVPPLRRALAGCVRVCGSEHESVSTLRCVRMLAQMLVYMEDFDAAEPLCHRCFEATELRADATVETVEAVHCLAVLLHLKGDFEGAAPLCWRALHEAERTLGKEHGQTVWMQVYLTWVLVEKGDAKAELVGRRALEVAERTLGEQWITFAIVTILARVLHETGQATEAEQVARRGVVAAVRTLGEDHYVSANNMQVLARVLLAKGDVEGAELFARRAEGAALEDGTILARDSANTLARVLLAKGDVAAAEPLARRTLGNTERKFGPANPHCAMHARTLAQVLLQNGDLAGAEPLARRALEIFQCAKGDTHMDTREAAEAVQAVLRGERDGVTVA